jgi:hypothetical protein
VVAEIMEAMHLPDDTVLATDAHYRCFRCLAGKPQSSPETSKKR